MITRRHLAAAPLTLLGSPALLAQEPSVDPTAPLPHKAAFAPLAGVYLNSASQHPVSHSGRRAINRYLDYKSFAESSDYSNVGTYDGVLRRYARLINAHVEEVAYVQSTTVGENLVLRALGYPARPGRIVTDELHYVGSLPTYAELAKRGVDVVTLRADSQGRIDIQQFADAIDDTTRLVSVSHVSMINGFRHDLAEISRLAHEKGAYVYADVVHSVGAVPFDVKALGVDFCASASYKWLMGEQGLGFLYAERGRLAELTRPWFGHYQLAERSDLGFPSPTASASVTDYRHDEGSRGLFAMGSQANIVAALLEDSLRYLLAVGVERIRDHRRPMVERLRTGIEELGLQPITPKGADTALFSFRHTGNAAETRARLQSAKIVATVAPYHVRVSPSVFNDLDDIERLLAALR